MSEFVIVTDSAADLPDHCVKSLGVEVVPLTYFVDDVPFTNYPDHSEMPVADFYAKLRAGANVHTSAVNPADFEDAFKVYLEAGKDVLYIGFSSALSATYQNAKNAAEELSEQFPERKIYTVDSLCASIGGGLLVHMVCKYRDTGADIDACRDYAEKMKDRIIHEFTVDDLGQLKRGGRISAATALVGTMLNIKPLLHVSDDGHLVSVGKVRGRRASIVALAEKAIAAACDEDETPMYICHGDCIEDAELLAKLVNEKLPKKEIIIGYTGPVIGSHSGQGTLAIFVVCAE
ncbi:MAG: DegV family protein [Clostridia bacterium]|nr:DegV family protein [Clostridia bacterium]